MQTMRQRIVSAAAAAILAGGLCAASGCDRSEPKAALAHKVAPEFHGSATTPAAAAQYRRLSLFKVESLGPGEVKPGGSTPELGFRLTNTSGRDIRAITGAIRVKDRKAVKVVGLSVSRDEPVSVGESWEVRGEWPIVDDRARHLLFQAPKQLRFFYEPTQIIYADGTVEKF